MYKDVSNSTKRKVRYKSNAFHNQKPDPILRNMSVQESGNIQPILSRGTYVRFHMSTFPIGSRSFSH